MQRKLLEKQTRVLKVCIKSESLKYRAFYGRETLIREYIYLQMHWITLENIIIIVLNGSLFWQIMRGDSVASNDSFRRGSHDAPLIKSRDGRTKKGKQKNKKRKKKNAIQIGESYVADKVRPPSWADI